MEMIGLVKASDFAQAGAFGFQALFNFLFVIDFYESSRHYLPPAYAMFWGFSRNDAGSGSNTRDEAVKAFETVVGRRSMARPDWRLQDLLSKATRNSYHSLPGGSRFYAGESRLVTDLGAPDRQQFTYPSKA
jgi:hypothetical protein